MLTHKLDEGPNKLNNILHKTLSNVFPSHVYSVYQSLETNYHTTPNNDHTALPILQKIISVPLCLLGRAEYSISVKIST